MNLDDTAQSDNVVDRSDAVGDPTNIGGYGVFQSGGALSPGDAYTNITNWLKNKVGYNDSAPPGSMADQAGLNDIGNNPNQYNTAEDTTASQDYAGAYGSGGAIPDKMQTTMHEFKHNDLHSGSKTGPKVTDRKQAIAIGLSQQRKANAGEYAEGGPVMGFDPEHAVIKPDRPRQQYDDGGAVPTPDDTSDTSNPDTGALPDTGAPSDTSMGGDNAMGAVQAALNYGRQKYGISGGGVPSPDGGSGIEPYLSGEGASHPNEVTAAEQAVNPDGDLSPKDAHMQVLSQLEPEDAFSVLQHDRVQHRGFSAAADHALDQGDADKASKYATEALANVPSTWDIIVRALNTGVDNLMADPRPMAEHAAAVGQAASDLWDQTGGKVWNAVTGQTKQTAVPAPQQPDAKTTASDATPASSQSPSQGPPDISAPATTNPQGIPDQSSSQQTTSAPRRVNNVTDAAGVTHQQFAIDLIDSKTGKVTQTIPATSDQLKQMLQTDFDTHVSKGTPAVLQGGNLGKPSVSDPEVNTQNTNPNARGYRVEYPPGGTTPYPGQGGGQPQTQTGGATQPGQTQTQPGNNTPGSNTITVWRGPTRIPVSVATARAAETQNRLDDRSNRVQDRLDQRSKAGQDDVRLRDAQTAEARARDNFLRNPALHQATNPDGTTRPMTPQERDAEADRRGKAAHDVFFPKQPSAPTTQPAAGQGGAKPAVFRNGAWVDKVTGRPVQ